MQTLLCSCKAGSACKQEYSGSVHVLDELCNVVRPYKRLKAYEISEERDVLSWKLTSAKQHACDGLHCTTLGQLGSYRSDMTLIVHLAASGFGFAQYQQSAKKVSDSSLTMTAV